MGYTRTNHRNPNNYGNRPNPMEVIGQLVDLIGAQEAAEYLDKYPTAAMKVYAAQVKIAKIKKERTETK